MNGLAQWQTPQRPLRLFRLLCFWDYVFTYSCRLEHQHRHLQWPTCNVRRCLGRGSWCCRLARRWRVLQRDYEIRSCVLYGTFVTMKYEGYLLCFDCLFAPLSKLIPLAFSSEVSDQIETISIYSISKHPTLLILRASQLLVNIPLLYEYRKLYIIYFIFDISVTGYCVVIFYHW